MGAREVKKKKKKTRSPQCQQRLALLEHLRLTLGLTEQTTRKWLTAPICLLQTREQRNPDPLMVSQIR